MKYSRDLGSPLAPTFGMAKKAVKGAAKKAVKKGAAKGAVKAGNKVGVGEAKYDPRTGTKKAGKKI